MSLEKLVAVLEGAGIDFSATDVMDLLWLAPMLSPAEADDPDAAARTADGQPAPEGEDGDQGGWAGPPPAKPAELHMQVADSRPGSVGGISAAAVTAPEAAALSDKLALARSLKPLKRRRQSRHEYEIDEGATAHSIAQTRLWVPSMRPRQVRWMDLALVIDTGESMQLWRQTAHELREVLADLGAFRDIREWFLDGGQDAGAPLRIRSAGSAARSPREIIDPSRHRMIVVFSDCVGPRWQAGELEGVLAEWAGAGPVVIAQPLPQRLWAHTSITPCRVQYRTREAGLPNTMIDCPAAGPGRIPVPVVEVSPPSAAAWSRLVSAAGSEVIDGTALLLGPASLPEPDEPEDPPGSYPAAELIRRFQLVASPGAMRLAECLAAAPVSVPVMRHIQQAVLGRADQAAVAEVFLGGLLCITGPAPGTDQAGDRYDFVAGVRDRLLARLPRSRALEVLRTVADSIGARLGRSREFRALVAGAGISGGLRLDADSRPFALIAEHVLTRMGADFAPSARQLRDLLAVAPTRPDLTRPDLEPPATIPDLTRPVLGRDSGQEASGPAAEPPGPAGTGALSAQAEAAGMTGGQAPAEAEALSLAAAAPGTPAPAAAGAHAPAGDAPAGDGTAGAQAAEGDTAAPSAARDGWRAFGEALAGVTVPRSRSSARPLVCPYCYHAHAAADTLFRCDGRAAPGRPECPREPDPVLQQEMSISTALPPVFKAGARRDEAPCPRCGGLTRTQLCPRCHSSLPPGFRSVDSRLIALVGSSNSGKTAFMTVLIHELRRSIGRNLNSSTMAADASTQERFARDYDTPLYQQGSLFPRTMNAQDYIQPLVFRFTMASRARIRARRREMLLSFADSAGEDLASPAKLDMMARYLAAADAVILMIDPLQLDGIREQITSPIALPAPPPPPHDPVSSVERVTRLLSMVCRSDVIDKPVAATVSKLDALAGLLGEDSPLHRPSPAASSFDVADSDDIQDEIRGLLERAGAGAISRTMARRYSRWRYFAVSALGSPPTADNELSRSFVDPRRIADPMMWILSEFGMLQQQGAAGR